MNIALNLFFVGGDRSFVREQQQQHFSMPSRTGMGSELNVYFSTHLVKPVSADPLMTKNFLSKIFQNKLSPSVCIDLTLVVLSLSQMIFKHFGILAIINFSLIILICYFHLLDMFFI